LVQSQRGWLASRNDCAAFADCLLARTQERTRILALKAPGPGSAIAVVPYFRSQAGSATRWNISYSAFRLEPPLSEAFAAFLTASEAELPFVALSDEDALSGGRFYIHDETIEPTYLSDRFLSVLDTLYIDSGGAHGNYGSIGRNFDLKKDAQATFSDVFTRDAAAKLVPECVALIAAAKKERMG
ncbi:MAG: DUF4163 domain-containing protein, partial [Aestuariivirgaceae bacterium]|nr:DUF4163 domain-containing protein [Aestuariivirgaceae bacterium]